MLYAEHFSLLCTIGVVHRANFSLHRDVLPFCLNTQGRHLFSGLCLFLLIIVYCFCFVIIGLFMHCYFVYKTMLPSSKLCVLEFYLVSRR